MAPFTVKHSIDSLFDGLINAQNESSQLCGVITMEPINVCYLLDISGSMYLAHDLIRKHLVDHLINRAEIELGRKLHHAKHKHMLSGGGGGGSESKFRPSHFNVVAFSDSVHPWSDQLVVLTRESVMVCAQWVKQHLRVKSSPSYMLPPLLYALNNSKIDQVVLITDGIPAEGNIHQTIARVSVAARLRPVHVVLVHTPLPIPSTNPLANPPNAPSEKKSMRNPGEIESEKFGQLLVETCGKGSQLRVVRCDVTGRHFDDVTLIRHTINKGCDWLNRDSDENNNRSVSAGLIDRCKTSLDGTTLLLAHHDIILPKCSDPPIPTWRTLHNKQHKQLSHPPPPDVHFMPDVPSPEAASLLIGRDVLARRNVDGKFYMGSVLDRCNDLSKFCVQFIRGQKDKDDVFSRPQIEEVSLRDIVNYDDAVRLPLQPGDKVLAATTTDSKKEAVPFDVGTAISTEGTTVGVSFWVNGNTITLDRSQVANIPYPLFHRLAIEEKASSTERRNLEESRDELNEIDKRGLFYIYGTPGNQNELHERIASTESTRCYPGYLSRLSRLSCYPYIEYPCYYYPPYFYHPPHYWAHRGYPSDFLSNVERENQDIVVTNVQDSFVKAKNLNSHQDEPQIRRIVTDHERQEFSRAEGPDGWSCYQQQPCFPCARRKENYMSKNKDEEYDDEFDEFLSDVRKWGDSKEVGTNTDWQLLFPPHNVDSNQRDKPPWRYWKRDKYEASPRSQPEFQGHRTHYSATRDITIQDSSGGVGTERLGSSSYNFLHDNYIDYSQHVDVNDEQTNPELPNLNEASKFQVPPSPKDKIAGEVLETADGKVDDPIAQSPKQRQQGQKVADENSLRLETLAKATAPKENNEGHKVDIETMKVPWCHKPPSLAQKDGFREPDELLRRGHVRAHWAKETNRYFDEIRDNLHLQKHKSHNSLKHARGAQSPS